ncbi:MAG: hypothetical protein R3F61_37825 [Myxococcota bacterium]
MTTWILSLIVPFVIAALWHGFSLQIASVLAGEEAPRFTRAMWVSWVGGLFGFCAVTVWSLTLGLFVSLFISSWVSWALGLCLQLLVTGSVYKRGLRFTAPAAIGVAGIHMFLSFGVNLLLGWLTYTFLWA